MGFLIKWETKVYQRVQKGGCLLVLVFEGMVLFRNNCCLLVNFINIWQHCMLYTCVKLDLVCFKVQFHSFVGGVYSKVGLWVKLLGGISTVNCFTCQVFVRYSLLFNG